MLCNDSEAKTCARLLISGYPNSAITEPEYYIAQLITVFVQFDRELVRKAVSPNGIPWDIKGHLPTIGEVNRWLSDKRAHQEHLDSIRPLGGPLIPDMRPLVSQPNLFVAADAPVYEDAVAFAKVARKDRYRYEENYVCYDGRIVNGYWIPKSWWDERHSMSYEQWEKRQVMVATMAGRRNLREDKRKELSEEEKKAALERAAQLGWEFNANPPKLSQEAIESLENRLAD